tara:strand:+ start:77 stop:592 length:516 start_codon:yes stop_codon:yes gene_type:complete
MRHFEVVLLVHPDQSDQLSDMLKRYQDLVTKNGGKIHRVEDIGRLQLAYTIKDMHKAHYVLMNLECDSQTLSEIKSSFEFNDSIMRHLVLRMANAETGPSKLFILHGKDAKQVDSKVKDKSSNTDQDKMKSTEAINQESNQDLDVKSETALTESDTQETAKQKEEEVDEKI